MGTYGGLYGGGQQATQGGVIPPLWNHATTGRPGVCRQCKRMPRATHQHYDFLYQYAQLVASPMFQMSPILKYLQGVQTGNVTYTTTNTTAIGTITNLTDPTEE